MPNGVICDTRNLEAKGYGFITPDAGGDNVYFNVKGKGNENVKSLTKGRAVRYTERHSDKSVCAESVNPIAGNKNDEAGYRGGRSGVASRPPPERDPPPEPELPPECDKSNAGGVGLRKTSMCNFDSMCMDCSCPLLHTSRRQFCLRLDACPHRLCPWIHPHRGFDFSARLCEYLEATRSTPSSPSLAMVSVDAFDKTTLKVAKRLKRARDKAMAAFAETSDRRMMATDKVELDIEMAMCVEIIQQIESFDAFVAIPFEELVQHAAKPEAWAVVKELLSRIDREIYRLEYLRKPVLSRRLEIIKFLSDDEHDSLVVCGATGSGKSTQLPQYIAELVIERNAHARQAALTKGSRGVRPPRDRKVICTQPRKVAAVLLAERVNEEWSAIIPSTQPSKKSWRVVPAIGCRTGNRGRKSWSWTVIEYVTEAVLLQDILHRGAAALRDVSVVILDDAHERSVTLDLLVGRLKLIRDETGRRDLKIIVMSATLDVDLFSNYFGGCPRVEIPDRMFPVEDIYKPPPESLAKPSVVDNVVECVFNIHRASSLEEGDILAFLPGQKEVAEVVASLGRLVFKDSKDANPAPLAQIFPLHDQQEPDEQRPIFLPPPPKHRKIVISTNLAETSVTIPGVRFVVDSGREKKVVYDARQNVTSIKEVNISHSAAQQRRGRAGRTASGVCYRLYSHEDLVLMNETQTAEVLSQPVNLTLLSLFAMKLDPFTFPWLEAPDEQVIKIALQNLEYLGALIRHTPRYRRADARYWQAHDAPPAEELKLTEFGRLAAQLQIEPSHALVLYRGHQMDDLETAAKLVGCMSKSQNFFRRAKLAEEREEKKEKVDRHINSLGDLVTMFRLYSGWQTSVATPKPPEGLGDEKDESDPNASVQKKRSKLNWKRGEEYCDQHFLNKHTIAMVSKMSFELVQQVGAFFKTNDDDGDSNGSVHGGHDDNEGTENVHKAISDDRLLNLILTGCFLNISVAVGDRGDGCVRSVTYQHVTPHNEHVLSGIIHPGSLLTQIDAVATTYICFLTMMNTSMLFLNTVTALPVKTTDELVALVKDISPKFAEDLKAQLSSVSSSKVSVDGFSLPMMIGKRAAMFRKNMSMDFKTYVQANLATGVYTAWCKERDKGDLQRALEEHRRALREEAILAVEEEILAGTTRCVYSNGGAVLCVLFGTECLSVVVNGLPDDLDETTFRVFLSEKYGPVRVLEVWEPEGRTDGFRSLKCSTNNKVAKITFQNKDSARNALSRLPAEFTRSLLIVRPGGVSSAHKSKAITGYVKISWDCHQGARMDDESLRVTTAQIRQFVPLAHENPQIETFFFAVPDNWARRLRQPGNQGGERLRAGFKVQYDNIEDVERAAAEWRTSYVARCSGDASWEMLMLTPQRQASLSFETFYESVIVVNKALYEWIKTRGRNNLDKILQRVRSRVNTKGTQDVSIHFTAQTLNRILAIQRDVMQALACDVFSHDDKDLLFTRFGRKRMESVSSEVFGVCYIHWDNQSHTVRVYGTKEERRDGLQTLAKLVEELGAIKSTTFLLKLEVVEGFQRDAEKKKEFNKMCKSSKLEDLDLRGTRAIARGTAEHLAEFEKNLREGGWLFDPQRQKQFGATNVCVICYCEVDDDNIQMQTCLHRACRECCKSWPIESSQFPIKCLSCSTYLCLSDIYNVFDSMRVGKIKSLAQGHFKLNEGKELVTYCVTKGCNMLVPLPEAGASPEEKKAAGGYVSSCEHCDLSFCLECSEKMGEVVAPHKGLSCNDNQLFHGPQIASHVHKIEALLMTRCPRTSCRQEFYGFDGCCALFCHKCRCSFCAICFKDCGNDAHSCARACIAKHFPTESTESLGYFLPEHVWQKHVLKQHAVSVTKYLESIADLELRETVFQAIQPMLKGFAGGDVVVNISQG